MEGIMKRIVLLALMVALVLPGAALARGSSTCLAYNPQLCNVPSEPNGTLPFTGLDTTLLILGGGTLLGAGLVIRRMSRRLD
jgi:hypothetical protein